MQESSAETDRSWRWRRLGGRGVFSGPGVTPLLQSLHHPGEHPPLPSLTPNLQTGAT